MASPHGLEPYNLLDPLSILRRSLAPPKPLISQILTTSPAPLSLLVIFSVRAFPPYSRVAKKQYNGALEEFMSTLGHSVVRRMPTLLAVLPLFVLCAGCSDFWVSDSSIQSVTVSPTAVILKADDTTPDTYTLSSTSLTVGGTTTTDTTSAKWTSSDATIVSAAADGIITAVTTSGGKTATITATDGGQSGTCKVLTYTGSAPTSLTLSWPSGESTPAIGAGFQVSAAGVLNGNSSFNFTPYVTWTTNASSIATVSSSGYVNVLSTATVGSTFEITATATFSGSTVTGTYTFTVA